MGSRDRARPSCCGATDPQIVLDTYAYDPATGTPTFRPASRSDVVDVGGFRTLRHVAWGGSHEGRTTIGPGIRARLPFRVLVLAGAPGHPDGARGRRCGPRQVT